MDSVCLYVSAWLLIHYCAILWLLIWTQIPRVHSSVVRAADCRSAGPWFSSGWRSWFITFVTGSDNLTNPTNHMINSMSPTTRKSVKMVAELDNGTAQWIFDNPNHEAAIHQLQDSHAEELRMIRQEAEGAGRTEHMRSRMDLKVGKPDVWNLDKTSFVEWDHRWRAYMGICSTSILSDLQNIRENPKRILIYSDFDSARQQASNEVYFSLVMLTIGKAATIVRTVRDNSGYEAYRLLRQRFEPEIYGKHLTSLTQILKFGFGSNPSEFLDKLIEWEGLIDKYEQETLETFCAPSWLRRHQRPFGRTCSSNVERNPIG